MGVTPSQFAPTEETPPRPEVNLMRPASWPMSAPRLYEPPSAPYLTHLLHLLFHMAEIVDYLDGIGAVTDEEWAAFEDITGVDVEQLRQVVDGELAAHGLVE